MMTSRLRSTLLSASAVAALSVLVLSACGGGGDSFSPSIENVAGTYSATTFTITSTAGSTNLLLLGATVTVTLASDGTSSGHLHVPGDDQGTDVDENLAGTWTLSGNTVTFSQSTSSLIEGAEFTAERDVLRGSGVINGLSILLVLGKTG